MASELQITANRSYSTVRLDSGPLLLTCICVVSSLVLGVLPSSASQDQAFEATTRAAELLLDIYSPVKTRDFSSYQEDAKYLTSPPFDASVAYPAGTRFGQIDFAGQPYIFRLSAYGNERRDIAIDTDRDGSFEDESPVRFLPGSGSFSDASIAEISTKLGQQTARLLFSLADIRAREPLLRLYDTTRRDGQIRLHDRAVAFALLGSAGNYSSGSARVFFDLGGGGSLDSLSPWEVSDRVYSTSSPIVVINGSAWEFRVEPDGGKLTMTRSTRVPPERPSLAPGSPAPEFEFVDLDGLPGKLSDYRGRIVLLYFWATHCGSCRSATPRLIELHERYEQQGLTILGINHGEPMTVVRGYVESEGVPWRQILQPAEGSPVLESYRVHGKPFYCLIDSAGRIVRIGLLGAVEAIDSLMTNPSG